MIWRPGQHAAEGVRNRAERFDLDLCIRVEDAALLWRAAAAHAMCQPGAVLPDREDVLGPLDDPSIGDCIAMLAGPRPIAGCTFERFILTPVSAPGASRSRRR